MPRPSTWPPRIERQKIDGSETKSSLYADVAHPSYDRRMKIEYVGRNWVFEVNSEDVVSTMSTAAGRAELPDWIVQSFRAMGLEMNE